MTVSCMNYFMVRESRRSTRYPDAEIFEEYKTMAEANFNLVLHQESRFAAEDFNDRLNIPFIELRRLYQTDKIQNQYQALASVLGGSF